MSAQAEGNDSEQFGTRSRVCVCSGNEVVLIVVLFRNSSLRWNGSIRRGSGAHIYRSSYLQYTITTLSQYIDR
jgi:hypothetical protein